MRKTNYVGSFTKRVDAYDKVTGKAKYVSDIKMSNMLYAKVLRAGVPHAKIISLDTSDAEKMQGVRKVITGKDCQILYGGCVKDQYPLVADKVRHAGEAVAVVIAASEKQAGDAVKKIKVEYENLPYVIDPIEAMQENAPLIHEKNGEYEHVSSIFPVPSTNIFHHYKIRQGDTEEGFSKCDVIIEREFEFPLSCHVQLEPHGVICRWDSPFELTIWSSSQSPFVVRDVIKDMFDLHLSNVRVIVPYVGGGFGGKSDVTIEPLCAYAAKFVQGYAVKFILNRKEVFTSTVVGRGVKARMKIGATKDGKLVALDNSLYMAGGAYGDTPCNVVMPVGFSSASSYAFDYYKIDAYGVYTNTPPVGAYRGYGHPEGHFFIERMMDILAKELNIPPLELRRKNFLCDGKINVLGQEIKAGNGNLFACLESVEKALYQNPLPEEDEEFVYGRGVASLAKAPVTATNASSCAILKFNEDGSVNLSISGIEMGQGCLTALSQIAADGLMLPLEKIRLAKEVDTEFSPYEWQTVASITTFRAGNAILKACQSAIEQIKQNCAEVFSCSTDALEYNGEYVFLKNEPANKIAVKDLVKGYRFEDGKTVGSPVISQGSHIVRKITEFDKETGQGNAAAQWTYGCQGAEVKISKKTGKIQLVHLLTCMDVGKVINPMLARGQMTGGMLQGMGAVLSEELKFKDGVISNADLSRYKIPAVNDMPDKFTVEFVETPQPDGPFGARCLAEHPTVAIAPAIVNAISEATKTDFYKIPILPEDILLTFKENTLTGKGV